MGNRSDEIAEGILKAFWLFALGFGVFAFIMHHPVFVTFGLILFAAASVILLAYKSLKATLGRNIDLLLTLASFVLGIFVWTHDGEGDANQYSLLFVIIGGALILASLGFFSAFRVGKKSENK